MWVLVLTGVVWVDSQVTQQRQVWQPLQLPRHFFPHSVAEEDGPTAVGMPIDCGSSGFGNVRGGPRQSSLNAVLDSKNKPGKKKPGLFKGIGSMFR